MLWRATREVCGYLFSDRKTAIPTMIAVNPSGGKFLSSHGLRRKPKDWLETMKFSGRKSLLWPLLLAGLFSFIPLFLFVAYPIGFWSTVNDNEPLGLANALNLAYRFADFRMYPAIGLTNHPGVQFYLTSWLALVCSGHPFAAGGQEPFFRDGIDHVEDYHEQSSA
jgi:hypothetical protein